MARKATASVKKIAEKPQRSKRVKLTRSEQYLINVKYLGEEPVFSSDSVISESECGRAHNWYHYMCSRSEARDYLEAYLRDTRRYDDLKAVKEVSDAYLPETLCWMARMLTRGARMSPSSIEWMEKQLADIRSGDVGKSLKLAGQEEKTASVEQPTINIKIDPSSDFIGRFEEEIDKNGWSVSMYDTLVNEEASSAIASAVVEYFTPIVEEAALLIAKNAPQSLLEGYSRYSKSELRDRYKFYSSIIADCERYTQKKKAVQKATRKQREKKPVAIEKKLSRVKMQSDSEEYNVVSLSPSRILNASEIWTFNTRYKLFTRLVAKNGSGLDIAGTSVLNYDETSSATYRAGKKALQVIQTIQAGHSKSINLLLSTCKKIDNVLYRLNENTLLLRATKSG